jgi:hypothetical protein
MNIFKCVFDAVGSIISQIMSQVNIVQQAVTQPLRQWVAQVTGGIWKGDGATKFVDEMTSQVIPQLANLMTVNTNFANSIKKTLDTLQQAVQTATGIANTLPDIFNSIF